jgi:biopolymer transport protein ExbD
MTERDTFIVQNPRFSPEQGRRMTTTMDHLTARRTGTYSISGISLVLFVFLVYLVMNPFGNEYHHSKLAAAQTGMPVKLPQTLVSVDRNGAFWIAGVAKPGPIRDDQLVDAMRGTRLGGGPDAALFLLADQHASYGQVLKVVGAAQALGIGRIELLVDCPRGRESLTRECRPAAG